MSRIDSESLASPSRHRLRILVGGALFTFLALSDPAPAQTDRFVAVGGADTGDCSVSGSPCASIDYAIGQATAGDTVKVMTGTYTEAVTIDRSVNVEGDYGVGFVRNGPIEPGRTVIDGGGANRPVTVDGAGVAANLSGFRLTNGIANTAPVGARFGGGLLVGGTAELVAQEIDVVNNTANITGTGGAFGGGIALLDGHLEITDSEISGNTGRTAGTTAAQGGGIYAAGSAGAGTAQLTMQGCLIASNVAQKSTGAASVGAGRGGGLHVGESDDTQIILRGNTWMENTARGADAQAGDGEGGAISVVLTTAKTTTVEITGDTFSGNVANAPGNGSAENAAGGAIFLNTNEFAGPSPLTVTLTDVTISGNTAKTIFGSGSGKGGAIYARQSTLIMQGGALLANTAAVAGDGLGGAIRLESSPLTADAVRIFRNIATDNPAGATFFQGGGLSATFSDLALTNCQITDNTAAAGVGEGAQVNVIYDNAGSSTNTGQLIHCVLGADALLGGDALRFDGDSGDMLNLTNTAVTNHAVGLTNIGADNTLAADFCLFFGNTSDSTGVLGGGTGHVLDDPAFEDPSSNSYHLTMTSAAINQGTDAGVFADIDGEARPAGLGFDIGIDEFDGMIIPPTTPVARPVLHVELAPASTDPSGRPVNYRYDWSSDGGDAPVTVGPTTATESELREGDGGATFDAGETWTVTVTPIGFTGTEGGTTTGVFRIDAIGTVIFQGFVTQ